MLYANRHPAYQVIVVSAGIFIVLTERFRYFIQNLEMELPRYQSEVAMVPHQCSLYVAVSNFHQLMLRQDDRRWGRPRNASGSFPENQGGS